ncbi:hypothetical protein [Reichenbachiella sp.]|uniref:hypothetical protein n=1 Tax=Reichenbachiella sp. TaxID=2184521 RepID=UPI0032971C9B
MMKNIRSVIALMPIFDLSYRKSLKQASTDMPDKKLEVVEIKLKNLNSVNFESNKLKAEFEEVKKRSEQLIESTKIDTDSLSNRFEF